MLRERANTLCVGPIFSTKAFPIPWEAPAIKIVLRMLFRVTFLKGFLD